MAYKQKLTYFKPSAVFFALPLSLFLFVFFFCKMDLIMFYVGGAGKWEILMCGPALGNNHNNNNIWYLKNEVITCEQNGDSTRYVRQDLERLIHKKTYEKIKQYFRNEGRI